MTKPKGAWLQTTQLGELEEVQVLEQEQRPAAVVPVPEKTKKEKEKSQKLTSGRARTPVTAWALVVCCVALLGLVSLYALSAFALVGGDKQISLELYGEEQIVYSQQPTVQALLEELGITLDELDILDTPLDRELEDGLAISIEKGFYEVRVLADGVIMEPEGEPQTVAEALALVGVELGEMDEVSHDLETAVDRNLMIRVARVYTQEEVRTEEIAPTSSRVEDGTLAVGEQQVLQEGEPGIAEEVVLVTYRDGEEIERELISSETIKEPGTTIIAYGVMTLASRGEGGLTATTASGTTFSYIKSMTVESTAYTWTGNRTATGTWPTVGQIAVDPGVIPLGSTVYVEGYGFATATDTGGAIKGNIVDVYFDTVEECISWGRRHGLTLYILE